MVNDLPLGAETGRKKRQTGSVESGARRGPSGPGHLPAEALGGRLVRPLHLSSPHLLSPVCRPSRAWPQPLSSQPLAGLGEVRPAPSRAGGRVGGPAGVEGQSGEPRGRGGGSGPTSHRLSEPCTWVGTQTGACGQAGLHTAVSGGLGSSAHTGPRCRGCGGRPAASPDLPTETPVRHSRLPLAGGGNIPLRPGRRRHEAENRPQTRGP